jgi:queuine tRNA-ribosyltransferase subunit QTRTD1
LGLALTFSLEPNLSDNQKIPPQTTKDKINLRDVCYKFDTRPIVSGCQCYSCTYHSRAYIHHLVNTHEMLANILLTIHNCYHYLEFFRIIRNHLKKNTFLEFKNDFLQIYSNTQNTEVNTRVKM